MHRIQSIRNQCLTLVSSLIEVFGDTAVQAVLSVVYKMYQTGEDNKDNPWLARFNFPAAGHQDEDSDQEDGEESKVPLQEGIDAEKVQQIQKLRKEAKEFKALLTELVYISKEPTNAWKRREAAILIITTFIKDISAFLIRNPFYDLL